MRRMAAMGTTDGGSLPLAAFFATLDEMHEASLRQFTVGALFKLGFMANVGIWVPISIILGVAAFFGANTVRWNGIPVYGGSGLVLSLFIGLLFMVVGTLLFVSGAKIASLLSDRLPRIPLRSAGEGEIE